MEYGPGAYSANGGGEFKVIQFTGASLAPMGPGVALPGSFFSTFCLEYSENFSSGQQFNWELNTVARAGGGDAAHGAQLDGAGWFDPLDARTAYLYTNFWKGTLSWLGAGNVLKTYDYDIGPDRVGSAAALQGAIWYLEGERTLAEIGGNTSDAYYMTVAATNAVNSGAWNGIGMVRVLNLTDAQGNRRQDQLVIVMPLPPAALLGMGLMSGVGAFGAWRRRRRQRTLSC